MSAQDEINKLIVQEREINNKITAASTALRKAKRAKEYKQVEMHKAALTELAAQRKELSVRIDKLQADKKSSAKPKAKQPEKKTLAKPKEEGHTPRTKAEDAERRKELLENT